MLSCCLKYRKSTESRSKVVRKRSGRIMILSGCAVCDSKNSKFIKEHEDSRLLSSLGIKTLLNKISILGRLFVLEVLSS